MKLLEMLVEQFIRQQVKTDAMQCGFIPARGTTDAIFIVRQLQERYLALQKELYLAFTELGKVSDRIP